MLGSLFNSLKPQACLTTQKTIMPPKYNHHVPGRMWMNVYSVITAWCYLLTYACIVPSGGLRDYPPLGFTINPHKKGSCPGRGVDFSWPSTTGSSCFARVCKFLLFKLWGIWIRPHVSFSKLILNLDFWGFSPRTLSGYYVSRCILGTCYT